MQTFLPFPDFAVSAAHLDYRRLGKQRVETWQILQALTRPDYGWQNHPAVKMWCGHSWALRDYGLAICDEWCSRGYNDTMTARFLDFEVEGSARDFPLWLGDAAFHSSHRAALLFKDPEHYSQFGWSEKPQLNYVWPSLGTKAENAR